MTRGHLQSHVQIAGVWKIICALAIMTGHLMVTMGDVQPGSSAWPGILGVLTFFGSRHFFFFSGYLAASGLVNLSRSQWSLVSVRFARIYVLVVASVTLGVLSRWLLLSSGIPDVDKPWPNNLWQGPIDWSSAFAHLLPTGLIPTNDFNYAIWYLYHELRLILLFPFFRWALTGGWKRLIGSIVGVLGVAVVGEYIFWPSFPLFRTSPFQTLGYGFVFMVGASTWVLQQDLKRRGWEPGKLLALGVTIIGIGVAYLESFGIRFPYDNPPLLNIQTAIGQMMVFLGLCWLLPDFSVPIWLRTATKWSVGIYVIHPPVHQFITHYAAASGAYWTLILVPLISIPLGALFFHGFVEPVSGLFRRKAAA